MTRITHALSQDDPVTALTHIWFSAGDPALAQTSFFYPDGGDWRVEEYPDAERPPPSLTIPTAAFRLLVAGSTQVAKRSELDDCRTVRNRLLVLVENLAVRP